ncbi:MAG TPA: glycoside hydrolase family 16 protein [Pseudomonadales bacterium]|nr:glycoside hydrolase family 16 protein [Pseudomonadales bacterium]
MKLLRKSVLIAILSAVSAVNAAEMCTEQTLLETFDGESLNQQLWSFDIGDGCDRELCGWGNNEAQFYHSDNVSLRDGHLVILAHEDENLGHITSGKIVTRDKFAQRYGRFEARIKVPAGLGLWPAFWLMPDQPEQRWPLEGEIDILERPGRSFDDLRTVIAAAHFGELSPKNTHFAQFLIMPKFWHDDFHLYAVDWTEDRITWSIDGREFANFSREDASPYRWPFDDKAFYVILNLAVGGTLGGEVHLDSMPAEMVVDYVKVSQFVDCTGDLVK